LCAQIASRHNKKENWMARCFAQNAQYDCATEKLKL